MFTKQYPQKRSNKMINAMRQNAPQLFVSLSALLMTTSLVGCGSGSEESDTTVSSTSNQPVVVAPAPVPSAAEPVSEQGDLVLVLRDDEDDFLTYDIEVLSIDLTREDGTQVSVQSNASRIDFIQYAELSELLSKNTIPAGKYRDVTFNLDYSDAVITIQDDAGTTYLATAQNAQGEAISTYALSLTFDEDDALVIRAGKSSTMTLDLDLATSNQIISFQPAIVQVDPFVNVITSAEGDREHRVRGLLQQVDSEANTVAIDVKPLRKKDGHFGSLTFSVDEATSYEINGEIIDNDDAFAQLALLAVDTPIVSFGQFNEENVYIASQVLAGSSVAWAGQHVFRGVVTERNEAGITLSGSLISAENKKAQLTNALTLEISAETEFLGRNANALSSDLLAAGQGIHVLGEMNEEGELDASTGIVHLKLSTLVGQVMSVEPLTVDLAKLNRRPSESFSFVSDNDVAALNVDPDNYHIADDNLTINDLQAQDWLIAKGYVADYLSAAEDFNANSLIKRDPETALDYAKVFWQPADTLSIDVQTSTINWSGEAAKQTLKLGTSPVNVIEDNPLNAIKVENLDTEAEQGENVQRSRYAIKQHGQGASIAYFMTAEDFVVALNEKITAGEQVKQITSKGSYDAEQDLIKATSVSVILAKQ